VFLVVGWGFLLWLWLVEYPKRLELFTQVRLRIPQFTQSVMETLPLLAAVAGVLTCLGLWMLWRRAGKWWPAAVLVFLMLALIVAVVMGLWLTDLAYEEGLRRREEIGLNIGVAPQRRSQVSQERGSQPGVHGAQRFAGHRPAPRRQA
jgi:hypothetical protein